MGVNFVEKIAVYPGTFDPVTYGHIHILKRAAKLFDKVIMAVAADNYKKTIFTAEERIGLIEACGLQGLNNVELDIFNGLLCDYLEKKGAVAIIRGLRAISDFEYEMQMGSLNRHLNNKVETVFLMADSEYSFISSSIIKNVAVLGGNIEQFVPDKVAEALREKKENRIFS
ncbi:MAG: pantetheine-phosphate adenylyltransferase [Clostridia bacterium]|nr:pantetheine-phosphate adenylyltransferase [Clostridia bacterium]MDN5323347.1 pantetheine-phosphate adenylyltransferase [Clostridia bacterium]